MTFISNEEFAAIERRALEITAIIELRDGPFSAEIVPDCSPRWHLIETLTGQEEKAVEFLVDRHFGVFMPKFQDDAELILDGVNICGGRGLIFPGHIFVFVWDIERHWRRIRTCPGVLRVLMNRPEHPVIVSDSAIDFIQALQFGKSPAPRGKKKSRKAKYQEKYLQPNTAENGKDIISITTKSYWRDIGALDGAGRNHLLHKALGLETITPLRGEDSTVPS